MEILIILLTGFLFGCGIYLMLRRSLARMLIGILFLGQAGNLAIFVAPGLGPGFSAIIPEGESYLPAGYPDPLPQALILTAIVIGFGVIAFAIVLLKQAHLRLQVDDLDRMTHTDS
ncbi:NADH-quinone oxidoreductase subunit K [Ruficoccus amylovorans]|uniref:NADH-quinone oxidoreductase subunit K n=1 Tax=Ruficoccus amylovorans TaxID=1804625 RepID=A0A842HG53_9BACT|nr:NADH-quinone oxidoreductase subunit K [Ruficoccus amylovorans]MBC2595259.1 NADH-quinone oxidoreductase subunit K [Ruficoccus amylovorans]